MLKIMLIDDDPKCMESLEPILTAVGFEVRAFSDPEQAIGSFDDSYGIVISDIRMPRMDGFEVLRQVKAKKPGTGVIMITGFNHQGDVVKAIHEGAYMVLSKPLNVFLLVAKVQELEESQVK